VAVLGFTQEEAAATLGITQPAVSQRLANARARIRGRSN
jgi:predicted transcriptional regulator